MSYLDNKPFIITCFKQLGVATLYALLYKLALFYLAPQGGGGTFFLASGVALAALLIGGRTYAWSIFLGALLANLGEGFSLPGLLGMASASTLGALLGAWLLRRDKGFDLSLPTLPDFLKLVAFGGCFGSFFSALIGTATLLWSGMLNADHFVENMLRWWRGDVLGVILLTPLILAWCRASPLRIEKKLLAEYLLIVGLAALAGQMVFLGWFHDSVGHVANGYWLFLFIVWAAIRLGIRGTTVVVLFTAIQGIAGAYQGVGFFAADLTETQLSNYWFYMLVLSLVGMTLATYISARKQAEATLRRSEQRFRDMSEAAGAYLWEVDANLVYTYVSIQSLHVKGYTPKELLGHTPMEFMPQDDIEPVREIVKRAIDSKSTFKLQHRDVTTAGAVMWEEVDGTVFYDAKGAVIGLRGTGVNITDRKQAEEKLQLAASVFTHSREGIMITEPDGTILDVNDAYTRITGYSRDEVLGQNPRILSSGRQSKDYYATMWRSLTDKGHWYGEIWNRRKNGEVYVEMLTVSTVRDAHGAPQRYVAQFSDITSHKEHQNQLEHIAHYDALTSLPNRVLLADRLHQGMAQAQRHQQLLAVAYIDLDGFKSINDNYGHEAGDELLIALAGRMKQALREGDTLARLGGDEFVVVLLDLADTAASVPMLSRLLSAAAQPVHINDLVLQVSASLGITFYPQPDDVDADQLLRQADQAMYQAKLAGKNRYHVFDAEHDRSVRGHHESLEGIRRALNEREFVLYYQPMVNMRTGTVIGAEALIRWQHPERGLLPPAEFLPTIEDHPLAVELGEWVIASALSQRELWHAAGLDIPVSVNVGARQLQQGDFVDRLRALLAAQPGIKPGDLELEVLETSALEDMTKISQVIEACREIGVSFALDDFGTGYSSLTYLKRLPVSLLKIDQSFVRDMLDDPEDMAILEGVIGLASAFRREVVAEGVETVKHGEMLLYLGCEKAQGYGIAHPMPADQLPGWSADWRTDPSWADLPAVNRDDLPLLFASADHRAWVAAMDSHLMSAREAPPPLDHHQCRFGTWLDSDGYARYGALPAFQTIDMLHRQVHALALELLELHSQGRGPEVLWRLPELHALRDVLVEQLMLLVREIRQ